MDVAAHTFFVDRQCDWLEELERILERFDTMSSAAQSALGSVIDSFLHDPDTTDVEIVYVDALLACCKPPSLRPALSEAAHGA